METIVLCYNRVNIGDVLGLYEGYVGVYRDDGKQNGNYYSGFRLSGLRVAPSLSCGKKTLKYKGIILGVFMPEQVQVLEACSKPIAKAQNMLTRFGV